MGAADKASNKVDDLAGKAKEGSARRQVVGTPKTAARPAKRSPA
jgi:hypothetical protein